MSKIKEYSVIEAGLAELKNKYAVIHDVSTTEGYNQCKKDAREVGKYRIELESKRKEIKGPALQKCKDIDEEAKRIQAEIALVEDPLKLAYKSVDERVKKEKEERLAKIESEIEAIKSYKDRSFSATPAEISEFIEVVDGIDCTEGFYELTKEALIARKETLEHLNSALKQAAQREIEEKKRVEQEAELEELRKIKAEQEEKERQLENERREIEHQKRLVEQEKQAEIDKAEALELAARDAHQASLNAKIAADKAENKRLEDVEYEKEVAKQAEINRQELEKQDEIDRIKKLEANTKHVGYICGQSKNDLVRLFEIDEEMARAIIKSIANHEIRNLLITY